MGRFLRVTLVFCFACVVTGCGGGSTHTTSNNSASPQPSVTVSAPTASVIAGGSLQLTATVSGASNPSLTWSVNGTAGGSSAFGTITAAGAGSCANYVAPVSVPNPSTVSIQAALVASPSINGVMIATVTSASLSANVADRFLEQTTFGPTTPLIAEVQQTGLKNFLASQLSLSVSAYADPAPTETNIGPLQQRFFVQLMTAQDQLRQRVAFALSQIFVISGDKINTPQAYTPYLNLLENDAFSNYRQIMQDVTLSPAMGHYLDMVNNDKPNATTGTHADENYARELMQLFTIGVSMLNEDGSTQLSGGNPIPTYTQDTVEAFARAYTGWTYPTQPGATIQKHNPAYWIGPMVPVESNHDTDAKQLLSIPALHPPVYCQAGRLPKRISEAHSITSSTIPMFLPLSL